MSDDDRTLVETVTLSEAKALIECAAQEQSFLLLSAPGVGKSDMVCQASAAAGLECRSLLGTQIAAEDVSGVPYIVGERSVFCPPRILLPESPKPFCLFLDELPACTPDIQKAFYSLLLERRLGEHGLPAGTWVVAAGNRSQDRALVRTISSALVNRVVILEIRADVSEWLHWARRVRGARRNHVVCGTNAGRALSSRLCAGHPVLDAPRLGVVIPGLGPGGESRFSRRPDRPSARRGPRLARRRRSVLRVAKCPRPRGYHPSCVTRKSSPIDERIHTDDATDNHPPSGQVADQCDGSRAEYFAPFLARSWEVGRRPPSGRRREASLQIAARHADRPRRRERHSADRRRTIGLLSAARLLPESPKPFCLFLDELPACAPDIQKAFYSLLLERRLGEHQLPAGTWVVAAGNRAEDRALVRTLSSALVNRVFLVHVRVDVKEWLIWAKANGVRPEILAFIAYMPGTLMRPVPRDPVPFSTPRAWASLSRSLSLAEKRGVLSPSNRRALAFGTVSPEDAAIFCAMAEESLAEIRPIEDYFADPSLLPEADTARWFIIHRLRTLVQRGELPRVSADAVNRFLASLPQEFCCAVLVDLVDQWSRLGASDAMLQTLKEVTGL